MQSQIILSTTDIALEDNSSLQLASDGVFRQRYFSLEKKEKTFSIWNLMERPTLGKMAIMKENAWVPNILKGTTG